MSITEENESAYGGSQTGTLSSVRSMTQVPENTATNFDNDDDKIDVGLTVRLQHKLKETQLAKEKLEKRLEQLELRGMSIIANIQLKSEEMERLPNKPYVNEVILRGQNLPLKC